MSFTIRPMCSADVLEAGCVWREAFDALRRSTGVVPEPLSAEEIELWATRYRYLLESDPDGSYVAVGGDRLVGVAVSHIREDMFVLSHLGVVPSQQDRGLGTQLLAHTLEYGSKADRGLIFSSSDPRALHRYRSAGFALHPAFRATGRSAPSRSRSLLRQGDASEQLQLVHDVDRSTRGAARDADIAFCCGSGATLYTDERGAYALVDDGRISAFGAVDEQLARSCMADLLAGAIGTEPLAAMWITSSQQWAFEAASEVKAELRAGGAVMARMAHMPTPYLGNALFG